MSTVFDYAKHIGHMTVLITLIRRGLTHTIYMGLLEVGSSQRGEMHRNF